MRQLLVLTLGLLLLLASRLIVHTAPPPTTAPVFTSALSTLHTTAARAVHRSCAADQCAFTWGSGSEPTCYNEGDTIDTPCCTAVCVCQEGCDWEVSTLMPPVVTRVSRAAHR